MTRAARLPARRAKPERRLAPSRWMTWPAVIYLIVMTQAPFVVTLYLYPEEARQGQLVPTPLLVRPGVRHAGGTTFGDFDMGLNYNLAG